MLTPGAENLRSIIKDLHKREQGTPPNYGKRGGETLPRYLGLGREVVISDGSAIGIYAHAHDYSADESWGGLPSSLHFEFISPASAAGLRQSIGHLSLGLFADGRIIPSNHSFESLSYLETLATPLGKWVTDTAVKVTRLDARASGSGLPEMAPVAATTDDIEPIRHFIDSPDNHIAHLEFNYSASGRADGLRVQVAT